MVEAGSPRPIRIGFVLPGLAGGGAERTMLSIIEALDRGRFAPTLIVFEQHAGHDPPRDVEVITLARTSPFAPIRLVSRVFQIARLARRLELDLLVSFLIGPNVVAIAAATRAGLPIVIGERSAPRTVLSREYLGHKAFTFWNFAVRLMYPRASMIITNTEGARRELTSDLKLPAERVVVLGNPLDLDRIHSLAAEPLPAGFSWPADPVLVHVGRFTFAKDHPTLLQAFARIRSRRAATLMLVGDGGDEASVRALVASLGLTNDVVFTGFTRNPYQLLARATISVLTSRFEGLPNALIESMSLGVPIVSTACQYGPTEVIGDNEFGVLTPVGDPDAFAAAVEALLDDPARRRELSERGRVRAGDFDRRRIGRKYEDVFMSVAGSNRR